MYGHPQSLDVYENLPKASKGFVFYMKIKNLNLCLEAFYREDTLPRWLSTLPDWRNTGSCWIEVEEALRFGRRIYCKRDVKGVTSFRDDYPQCF